MLVEEFTVPSTNNRTRTVLRLRCDTCDSVFTRDFNVAAQREYGRHYCNGTCHAQAMRSGGPADASRRETCRERFGSDYLIIRHDVASRAGRAAHTPEIERRRWKKIHQRWASMGRSLSRGLTLPRSREEIEFFRRLESEFGVTFTCPKYVNGWFIDGYCNSADVYVQYDGTYWHSSPHAQARDGEQDAWFKEQGLILVRVTDREWKDDSRGVLVRVGEVIRPGRDG